MPLRADDAAEVVEFLDDPVMREWLDSSDLGDLRARFSRWEGRRSPDGRQAWLNWVVRLRGDGAAVGWVQATVERDAAEVSYAMLPARRRNGYCAEAVAGVVEALDVSSVEAHIAPENEASAGVAAAVGLRRTGELDHGEVVWRS